jgi:hypothetical protein
MSNILDLHTAAKRRGGTYEQRKARWAALHAAAAELCQRLPFKWHAVAMDNPTQNHTGVTNGADHIVLDGDFTSGRLHRTAGQALCGGDTANLWNPAWNNNVDCKRCLELAQRHATKEAS